MWEHSILSTPCHFQSWWSFNNSLSLPMTVGTRLESTVNSKKKVLSVPFHSGTLNDCPVTASRTARWGSSNLTHADLRTSPLKLCWIHSNSVSFAFWTSPKFSGERAALKVYWLTASCHESSLASTFAALSRGGCPFPISCSITLMTKYPEVWRKASKPQLRCYALTTDHWFLRLHDLGLPLVFPNQVMTPYSSGRVASLHSLWPPFNVPPTRL